MIPTYLANPTDEKNEFSGGFAIHTDAEGVVQDNARDRFGPDYGEPEDREEALRAGFVDEEGEITQHGWDILNKDVARLERNALAWLRKNFQSARDEGHDSYSDLIGTFYFDPRDPAQADLLLTGLGENGYASLHFYDLPQVTNGTSRFSSVLDGGQITFFAIPDEAKQIAGDTLLAETRRMNGQCPRHGYTISNGMFDAPCPACEAEMDRED